MAVILADRVQETTTTIGTGAISMGGAVTGYRAFSAAFANGNQTYYCIAGQGTSEWEVGIGTLSSGTPWTMARSTVLASSNANAAVNFSAGTKVVFTDIPASVLALILAAVPNSRQIATGDGLTGGGDLTNDRTLKINTVPGSGIASAATTDLSASASLRQDINGTTGISSFGPGANLFRFGKFTGTLTLTHSATFALNGAANITVNAGDWYEAASDGSANWTVNIFKRGTGSILALLAGTSAGNLVQLDGSGKLPPLDGSQLINIPSGVTTANVETAMAGMTQGDVGTLAFATGPSSTALAFGATVAGSSLSPSNAAASSSSSLSGTWRCLGRVPSTTSGAGTTTLFIRIS